MTVVQEGPTSVHGTAGASDPAPADLLFEEAKQRERRRRLVWLGVVVIVLGGVMAAVAAATSHSKSPTHPTKITSSGTPKSTRSPIGSVVPLKEAGPLAVGPTGALYVSDPTRHQVLVRQANGQFRVVAGNGQEGFTGDSGPATKAELSHISAMVFAPNGDLYLADGSRVRVVDRAGTIRTVAGNGRSGSVPEGTPALSAPLGPISSIAFSPGGELYLSNSRGAISQLFRLTSADQLDSMPAILPPGQVQMPGPLNSFDSIAVDSDGNVYASSSFDGWSVFKVSPEGVATYLGYARRSGGNTAIVQRGSDDVIEVDDGPNILRVEGDQLVANTALSTIPGIDSFIFTDYFALAPSGALYADNLGGPGSAFEPYQQIVSVTNSSGASLWRGASRS